MNNFFETQQQKRVITYKMGKKLKSTQYVKLTETDKNYLRYMYSMFWGHVKTHRADSDFAKHMYYKTFVEYQDDLPRPTKLDGHTKNTWGTFLQGIEHNFLYEGTQDFTIKQLSHVVKIVNVAVEYFTLMYPEFEANVEAYSVELLRT